MKKCQVMCLLTTLLGVGLASSPSVAQESLSGNERLACEAVLCLSSSSQPSECAPSIKHYFGITDKRPDRMIQKRMDFLNLCPVAYHVGMPSLISAIANGAGRCDADFLNQYNTFTYQETICKKQGFGHHKDEEGCITVTKTAISNELPPYCVPYHQHQWTRDLSVKYVGQPKLEGKWVNAKDYAYELKKYEQQLEQLKKTASGRERIKQAEKSPSPKRLRDSHHDR